MMNNSINTEELNKLIDFLSKNNINFRLFDPFNTGYATQVSVYDKDDVYQWDAVTNDISMGGKDGLIEIMGNIVQVSDDVEGYLTSDDIIQRIKIKKDSNS